MITPVGEKTYAFRGLSTDSKPIEKATNGSSFIEIDTGKVFLFDAANTDWKEFTTISISGAGGAGGGIDIQVLDALPSEGKKGVFYLIPSTGGDGTSNYDQYVWDTNSATFKKIGSAGVSLVDYYTKSEVNALIPDVSGFITEIPAEYITESELDAKGYLTDHQSLEAYATKDFVGEEIAKINISEPDLSNYYNKEEVETLVENIEHPKQTYYLDFTSTVPKQPETLTDEIKEAAIQVIAGKQVAIYLRDDKVADSYLNNYGAGTVKLIESDTYYQIDFGRVARSHTVASGITANWDYTYSLLCSKTNSSFFQYTATASKQEFVTQSYVTTAIKNITHPAIPTKLSELTNDVPYATEQYVTDAIAAIQEPVEQVQTRLTTEVLPKVNKVDEIVPIVEEIEPTVGELKTWVENKEYLQDIDLDGYATEDYVTDALATYQSEAEIYKVDFNSPNYADAKAAYEGGKLLVLVNAAPDINSYAVMNYVSEKYITFTKFLTSRSEAYGSFNTYYLSPANTWEVSKEVRLNKVEANPSEEATGELNKVRIGKEIFTIPQAPSLAGYATEEFVNKKILEAEIADKEADLEAYYTKSEVDALIPDVPTKVSELENDANYTNETKVLELIAANTVVADNKIGVDFTTDITVGRLTAGTEIKADMTIGEILRRILMCDHNWIEATCTTPKTCSLCGKTEGEALGHIEEVIEGKAATCEETGLTDGVRCSRCGEILVEQQVIPALGHNYTSEVTLEPTCTTDGVRTYTCSNGCGETYTEVIPTLGHNYVSEVIKPATCAEEGLRKYTCTRCGDSYEEVIPKLEHQTAIREENRIEPDCTNTGSYDKVTYCTECGEVLNRETIILPALGHDYGDWVITKQPEVGVPGEQQKTCKRCGDVITEEIPALPTPDEPTKLSYLSGTFGNVDLQEWPEPYVSDWEPEEQEEISMHYVNNMIETSVESENDLVGRHGFAITTPFVTESNSLASYGDTSEDPFMTHPTIILPEGYVVEAWNTDVDNSDLSEQQLSSYTLADGRIAYYPLTFKQQTGTTEIHYLTISKN